MTAEPLVTVPAIEIAVQDAGGTAVAIAAGADRVELCSALVTGGLTPSIGTVLESVEAARGLGADHAVHVLVRSRAGGFVYDAREVSAMVRDIRALRSTGIAGVVIGAMRPDGTVDEPVVARLVDAADGLHTTFHRAIDTVARPSRLIDALARLGISRVLTSGAARRSIDGVAELAAMQEAAGRRLEVMAGGGVAAADIPELLDLGLAAVHLSARRSVTDPAPSGPGGGAETVDRTDPQLVRAAVAARSEWRSA
ncbi:copper homeostasis protein [Agromyces cerinus]|uniref:copper homeostasis protein CutC n=1 Tax=Agromyces cerinus TaxID=33878 RepID=UPI0027DB09DB|nr:copper homeostasis protein CutC [Agromyces cerinus]MBM7830146.1 copper homeostasis protein [Agromyces cerinus]